MATRVELAIFEDKLALAHAAAAEVTEAARRAIARHHEFHLVLSGGSTPRSLHQVLSEPETAGYIDWSKVQIFWGDERCVPPDDPESNYRMAAETLLARIPIPERNIHRMRGELSPPEAASDYQLQIARAFNQTPDDRLKAFPRFDLILLGLGPDGHTASLFPGSEAISETRRWVVAVPHDHPPEPLVPRLSMTLPLLRAAHNILFMVTGEGKAERLAEVLSPPTGDPLPAQLVKPADGRLLWLADRPAASRLTPEQIREYSGG